ncbi:MAG TPA: hypothetical protein VH022_11145 [Candidatus Acidoferrum sp.]|nr:hypothetical protein [Candidatus Acidoferrum sp.]
MKILLQLGLAFVVLYLCGVAGSFLGGVVGAFVAVLWHAGPYAVTMVVRVFSAVFFCGFVALAWMIYTRFQKRKLRRKSTAN